MGKTKKQYIVDECIRIAATAKDVKSGFANMRIGRIAIKDLEIDFSSHHFTVKRYSRRTCQMKKVQINDDEVDSQSFNKLRKMVGILSLNNSKSEDELIEVLSKL